jgi:hypothetical protein
MNSIQYTGAGEGVEGGQMPPSAPKFFFFPNRSFPPPLVAHPQSLLRIFTALGFSTQHLKILVSHFIIVCVTENARLINTFYKQTKLQTNVAQYHWVSQNLNLSHTQSCCAISICKSFIL